MIRRPFLPTARQTNLVILVGLLSLGYALYLRYLVVENSVVGLACEGGLSTWLCATRKAVIGLFTSSAFGMTAVAVAALHFVRPSIVLLLIALVPAAFGIVLYNVALSSLAVALLILSLARPQGAEAP